MKRKEINQLHKQTLPELRKLLEEIREKLLKLKMDFFGGKVKDVRTIAKTRDDLARTATVIREKELEVKG